MIKEIKSFSDLKNIGRDDNVVLINDIDCDNAEIECLVDFFRGTIEGNGFSVKNLILTEDVWGDEQHISLIHYMSGAKIMNIHFENITIRISKNGYTPRLAGLCVECVNSDIQNVSMSIAADENVPVIYDANGGLIDNVTVVCNGQKIKPVKYM